MQHHRASAAGALVAQHGGLEAAGGDGLGHILPGPEQGDLGVVKKQPLVQLLAEGKGEVVVAEVADNAAQLVDVGLLGGAPENA